MNYFGRIVNGIRDYYSEINSATLTGAIDVIVVRQSDGSFVSSPFHVRFGKLGVLRSREKIVDISINDEPVDLHMKLGDGGEAFFVKPCPCEEIPQYLCTSPIPETDSLISDGIAQMKKEIKDSEQQLINSDDKILQGRDTSDIDSNGETDIKAVDDAIYLKRSPVIPVPLKKMKLNSHQALNDYYPLSDLDTPINTPNQSGALNTVELLHPTKYSSDTEIDYHDKEDHTNSHMTLEATWKWGRLPQGLDTAACERKPVKSEDAKRVEGRQTTNTAPDEGMYLEDLLSADKEVASLYLQQNMRHEPEKGLPNVETEKTTIPSSKSDTHLSKMEDVTNENKSWLKNTQSADDTKIDPELSNNSRKSSEVDCQASNEIIDSCKSDSDVNKSDDVDSGVGSSTSPDDITQNSENNCDEYRNIALSLCGDLRRGKVSRERFVESSVSFEEFLKQPTQILSDPKLVIRIGERYYNANVAVPMLMSYIVYQEPLPKTAVDDLMKEHMPKKAKRRGYSWFSWRSPPENNESTDEESERKITRQNDDVDESDSILNIEVSEPSTNDPVDSGGENELVMTSSETMTTETYKKVLELSSEQLASLNLKDGENEVAFSVTTKYQGTAKCTASIFLYNYYDKIIISDIDGTITKSDVLGHILPASFWAQSGVARLFSSIQTNGYKFMYLSARPIGQAELTRQHLKSVVQENLGLPNGPLFLSPSSLIKAFHRELIEKRPQDFKIPCLRNIRKLFPSKHEPFFAGFGNRMNDVLSYRAVGIPVQRIFTVNHKGEVKNEFTNAFQSSYTELRDLVDQMFPSYIETTSFFASDHFSSFTFWRTPLSSVDDSEPSEITSSVQDTEITNKV